MSVADADSLHVFSRRQLKWAGGDFPHLGFSPRLSVNLLLQTKAQHCHVL